MAHAAVGDPHRDVVGAQIASLELPFRQRLVGRGGGQSSYTSRHHHSIQ
jgi:hypothetical protein